MGGGNSNGYTRNETTQRMMEKISPVCSDCSNVSIHGHKINLCDTNACQRARDYNRGYSDVKPIIPVVAAVIINKEPYEEWLLHKKTEAHDEKGIPRNPELLGLYEFAGGMMEYGESPIEALKREISEKLHIDITVEKFLFASANTYKDKKEYLVLYYKCKTDFQGTPKDCLWIPPYKIETLRCLPTTYIIANLFYKGD